MTLTEILTFGWPAAQWSLREQDYSTLEWHPDNVQPKPSLQDVLSKQVDFDAVQSRHLAFNQGIASGFLVQPEGFTLRLEDADRAAFAQMLALVKEALELGMITSETPQLIADHAGTRHEVTTLRFRQIMVAYGLHYKSLWDALSA
jgi:hypothetical protein